MFVCSMRDNNASGCRWYRLGSDGRIVCRIILDVLYPIFVDYYSVPRSNIMDLVKVEVTP